MKSNKLSEAQMQQLQSIMLPHLISIFEKTNPSDPDNKRNIVASTAWNVTKTLLLDNLSQEKLIESLGAVLEEHTTDFVNTLMVEIDRQLKKKPSVSIDKKRFINYKIPTYDKDSNQYGSLTTESNEQSLSPSSRLPNRIDSYTSPKLPTPIIPRQHHQQVGSNQYGSRDNMSARDNRGSRDGRDLKRDFPHENPPDGRELYSSYSHERNERVLPSNQIREEGYWDTNSANKKARFDSPQPTENHPYTDHSLRQKPPMSPLNSRTEINPENMLSSLKNKFVPPDPNTSQQSNTPPYHQQLQHHQQPQQHQQPQHQQQQPQHQQPQHQQPQHQQPQHQQPQHQQPQHQQPILQISQQHQQQHAGQISQQPSYLGANYLQQPTSTSNLTPKMLVKATTKSVPLSPSPIITSTSSKKIIKDDSSSSKKKTSKKTSPPRKEEFKSSKLSKSDSSGKKSSRKSRKDEINRRIGQIYGKMRTLHDKERKLNIEVEQLQQELEKLGHSSSDEENSSDNETSEESSEPEDIQIPQGLGSFSSFHEHHLSQHQQQLLRNPTYNMSGETYGEAVNTSQHTNTSLLATQNNNPILQSILSQNSAPFSQASEMFSHHQGTTQPPLTSPPLALKDSSENVLTKINFNSNNVNNNNNNNNINNNNNFSFNSEFSTLESRQQYLPPSQLNYQQPALPNASHNADTHNTHNNLNSHNHNYNSSNHPEINSESRPQQYQQPQRDYQHQTSSLPRQYEPAPSQSNTPAPSRDHNHTMPETEPHRFYQHQHQQHHPPQNGGKSFDHTRSSNRSNENYETAHHHAVEPIQNRDSRSSRPLDQRHADNRRDIDVPRPDDQKRRVETRRDSEEPPRAPHATHSHNPHFTNDRHASNQTKPHHYPPHIGPPRGRKPPSRGRSTRGHGSPPRHPVAKYGSNRDTRK